MERLALARVYAVSEPPSASDPAYLDGLRDAVSVTVDYGIAAIELGEGRTLPPPATLLTQARLAARNGVPLDTVLRRYFSGYFLFGDFLAEIANDEAELTVKALWHLLRMQAEAFDRLAAAVGAEYANEIERARLRSSQRRRVDQVRRLLAGEPADVSNLSAELGYTFDKNHVGLHASGRDAPTKVRELAASMSYGLLLVCPDEDTTWAWLADSREIRMPELQQRAAEELENGITLGLGESNGQFAGWRLTHSQAAAALRIAIRSDQQIARYSDVALLASASRDDLLVDSLRKLYLDPLKNERDGGAMLRETLSAYFAAGRNISSAASSLGASRNTVASRLRLAEARLGKTLSSCAAGLEIALQMSDIASSLGSQMANQSSAQDH